jgi:hypothetical protein
VNFRVSDRPPGAKPGQKNLLVRVVLPDLAKTFTNETANALGDRTYGRHIKRRNTTGPRMTPRQTRSRNSAGAPTDACRNEGADPDTRIWRYDAESFHRRESSRSVSDTRHRDAHTPAVLARIPPHGSESP